MANLAQSKLDGVRVVQLTGTLNQHGVEEIQSDLSAEARSGEPVVVDLSGVAMINTPGLAALLSAHRDAQRSGARMIITNISLPLQDMLHRCQLDRILIVVPQMDEAMARAKA